MSVNPRLSVPISNTIFESNTKTISYQHNANNQRISKSIDGTVVEKYLWANLTTLLATYDASGNLKQRFEYADSRMPVAMTMGASKYYLHYDQVGSLRAVSDNSHNIIKEISYDTFGNILSDSNEAFKVPFGFAGGLYDADTKLTRFGYRDYDAYVGKWTAKDPIGFAGGDSNLYGYVLGDPVNFFDPSGKSIFTTYERDTLISQYCAGGYNAGVYYCSTLMGNQNVKCRLDLGLMYSGLEKVDCDDKKSCKGN